MMNRAGLTVLLIVSCAACMALVIRSVAPNRVAPNRVAQSTHLVAQHDN